MTNLTATEIRDAMLRALEETARRFPSGKTTQPPSLMQRQSIDEADEETARHEASVNWTDLQSAFELASFGGGGNDAFLCRPTGEIFYRSDVIDEELPDDVDDGEKYIRIPHKNELDLGKRLVLAFAEQYLPGDYDNMERMFGRRGAYGRFNDLLDRRRARETWYDFRNKAEEEALRAWCAGNSIKIINE
jgi:hypothetical protein